MKKEAWGFTWNVTPLRAARRLTYVVSKWATLSSLHAETLGSEDRACWEGEIRAQCGVSETNARPLRTSRWLCIVLECCQICGFGAENDPLSTFDCSWPLKQDLIPPTAVHRTTCLWTVLYMETTDLSIRALCSERMTCRHEGANQHSLLRFIRSSNNLKTRSSSPKVHFVMKVRADIIHANAFHTHVWSVFNTLLHYPQCCSTCW